jgi:hypothetical protein
VQSAERKFGFCTNLPGTFQESFGNLKHYRPFCFTIQNQWFVLARRPERWLAKACDKRALLSLVLAATCTLAPKIGAEAQTARPEKTATAAIAPPINGVKVVTYPVFQEQLRQAIVSQGVNLAAYSKDIELISGLASKCPARMPNAPFDGNPPLYLLGGGMASQDAYYSTPTARACEFSPLLPGGRGQPNQPNPVIDGAEPRKLYLLSRAVRRTVVAPGSNKIAFDLAVFMEPVDQSIPTQERCGLGKPCMSLILDAIVISDEELAAAQHRVDEVRRKQEAAAAEVAEQRRRQAALEAERARAAAEWAALPEEEKQRRREAEQKRQQIAMERHQQCTSRCRPVESSCHDDNTTNCAFIMGMNGFNASSGLMAGIAADDCSSKLRACVSSCEAGAN